MQLYHYYLSSMTLTLVACMSVQHRRQCWGDKRYQISIYLIILDTFLDNFVWSFVKGLFAECCYNSFQLYYVRFQFFVHPKITQDAIQQHTYSVYIVCFPSKGYSSIPLASVAPAPAPTLVRPRPDQANIFTPNFNLKPSPG